MATQVKRRRGTTAENDNFTGALAEFTFDTETHHIRVHDGIKQGGYVIPVITDPLNPGKYTKVTIDDQGLVIGAEPLSVDDLPSEIPMDKVFGLPLALENKQDKIYAGENIVIDETTISAIDTKYTAGQGIVISQDNVISSTGGGVTFDDIIIKSETIPDATEASAGSVYMYMGETNPTYTHGYIYQNVITMAGEHRWERVDVQPGTKWGNVTGDLADQEDLSDALDTINDRIDNVEARGRFLALWNATTGLPESIPQITPYTYKTGDYYIVGAVGETNYKPYGSEFVEGQPSTEVETEELTTDDVYYYDGAVWRLQVNHGKTVSFANLAGQPEDNTALKDALDAKQPAGDYATNEDLTQGLATKQNTLVSGTNIKTLNNQSILGSGNIEITSASAQWGKITGTLSSQTDLKDELDSKTAVIIRRW